MGNQVERKSKSINRKGRKEHKKDRKELLIT